MPEGFFKKKNFQGLKSVLGKCKTINLRVNFVLFSKCDYLIFYLKLALKISLEKLRKNGDFTILNKSLEALQHY